MWTELTIPLDLTVFDCLGWAHIFGGHALGQPIRDLAAAEEEETITSPTAVYCESVSMYRSAVWSLQLYHLVLCHR